MKTLRWIISRRVLAVAFLLVFVGSLTSYASDGLELIQAAEKGDVAKVTTLLGKGADVNAKDNDGETALWMAVEYDGVGILMETSGGRHSEVVKILLAQGADVNAKDNAGLHGFDCGV